MDQKNTIVKCFANPNCLFNHNGVCDNYVINIGADGGCQEYVETESNEEFIELEGLNYQKVKFNRKLFQLCAKCIHSLTPAEYDFSPACLFSEDASIRLTGNCPYASQRLRGQRAKCDFYEDGWVDPEIIEEVCQPFHLCDTKCKYWQLDSYSEWVCSCMAGSVNPRGYCPHYDDGGEE